MSKPNRKVCCHVCHRYRDPAKMEGTRCADRDACRKAAFKAAPVSVPKSVLRKQFTSRIE
jgi:hypothetical protein